MVGGMESEKAVHHPSSDSSSHSEDGEADYRNLIERLLLPPRATFPRLLSCVAFFLMLHSFTYTTYFFAVGGDVCRTERMAMERAEHLVEDLRAQVERAKQHAMHSSSGEAFEEAPAASGIHGSAMHASEAPAHATDEDSSWRRTPLEDQDMSESGGDVPQAGHDADSEVV
eukprot:TRINITY_DN45666_c0_g1_i1.p1 TRINITY_DN45666_c0_g1~~TRINITY_DN45666_c0_g1_i1.p1  ORF type:complete len:171 (+),score=30.99 TRINITY_DN45666_c0_g1_i1:232-744(+)